MRTYASVVCKTTGKLNQWVQVTAKKHKDHAKIIEYVAGQIADKNIGKDAAKKMAETLVKQWPDLRGL